VLFKDAVPATWPAAELTCICSVPVRTAVLSDAVMDEPVRTPVSPELGELEVTVGTVLVGTVKTGSTQ
jgi:hypothetical protein